MVYYIKSIFYVITVFIYCLIRVQVKLIVILDEFNQWSQLTEAWGRAGVRYGKVKDSVYFPLHQTISAYLQFME